VYEHIRRQLQDRMAAAQGAVTQAEAAVAAAQAAVEQATRSVAEAEAGVAGAQSVLDGANGAAAPPVLALDAARARREEAANELARWLDEEPDNELLDGKPNPRWVAWNRKRAQLARAVDTAAAEIVPAERDVASAVAARDAAAVALAQAQTGVGEARARLRDAEGRLLRASAQLVAAQAALGPMAAAIAELDARAARILAEPFDADAVDRIAEEDLAAAVARRRARQTHYQQRVALAQQRAVTLAAHDQTADELAAVAETIRSWPEAGRYPDLAGIAAGLDGIANESRAQRALPPGARSDDLRPTAAVLGDAVQRLRAILPGATAERDQWASALAADADELARINADAPVR
jgi:hypothetical protein